MAQQDANEIARQVSQAVSVMNFHQDVKAKQEAAKWLEHFQTSPLAWQVCHVILTNAAVEAMQTDPLLPYVVYFAAQSLRTKIVYECIELSVESKLQLKLALFGLLKKFEVVKNVRTQLGLSFADLVLQIPAVDLNLAEWTNTFQSNPVLLMELLTFAAEEVENHRVAMDEEQRKHIFIQLQSNVGFVLDFLTLFLQPQFQSNSDLKAACLRCVGCWLSLSALDAQRLSSYPYFKIALDNIEQLNRSLFDDSVEVICKLIRQTEDTAKHHGLVSFLIPKVVSFAPMLQKAFESHDDDISRALCRLYDEFGESYLHIILEGSPEALKFADILLYCTTNGSYDIANIVFPFWYCLFKAVWPSKNSGGDVDRANGGSPLPIVVSADNLKRAQTTFTKYFSHLLNNLLRFLILPTNYDKMQLMDQEEISQMRQAVGSHIKDCCIALTFEVCLNQLAAVLSQQLETFAQKRTWENLEAILYAIRCIGRLVNSRQNLPALEQIFQLMMQLAEIHPSVRYTCILIVGRYSEWLRDVKPQLIPQLVGFVLQGMFVSTTRSAASQSFQYLSESCANYMVNQIDLIFEMWKQIQTTAAKDFQRTEIIQFIEAASLVISCLPPTHIDAAVNRFAEPITTRLQLILTGQVQNTEKVEHAFLLSQLASIMQKLDPEPTDRKQQQQQNGGNSTPKPSLLFFKTLLPIIQASFVKFRGEIDTITELTKICRQTVTINQLAFAPYVQTLTNLLVDCFTHTKHAACLYVLSVMIRAFAKDADLNLQTFFSQAIESVLIQALASLQNPKDYQEFPEMVTELYDLLRVILNNKGILLLGNQPLTQTVLSSSLQGISVQHRQASQALLIFLAAFIYAVDRISNPSIQQTIGDQMPQNVVQQTQQLYFLQFGPILMNSLFSKIADFPFGRLDDIGNIVKESMMLQKDQTIQWIANALETINYITPQYRIQVVQNLQKNSVDPKFPWRDFIREFASQMRQFETLSKKSLK